MNTAAVLIQSMLMIALALFTNGQTCATHMNAKKSNLCRRRSWDQTKRDTWCTEQCGALLPTGSAVELMGACDPDSYICACELPTDAEKHANNQMLQASGSVPAVTMWSGDTHEVSMDMFETFGLIIAHALVEQQKYIVARSTRDATFDHFTLWFDITCDTLKRVRLPASVDIDDIFGFGATVTDPSLLFPDYESITGQIDQCLQTFQCTVGLQIFRKTIEVTFSLSFDDQGVFSAEYVNFKSDPFLEKIEGIVGFMSADASQEFRKPDKTVEELPLYDWMQLWRAHK